MQRHQRRPGKKIFAASTTAFKLHLRQELNNIVQRDMMATDYTTNNKENCDGYINVIVDVERMVQVCLGDLAQRYG